jgi:hypothetical protein
MNDVPIGFQEHAYGLAHRFIIINDGNSHVPLPAPVCFLTGYGFPFYFNPLLAQPEPALSSSALPLLAMEPATDMSVRVASLARKSNSGQLYQVE